MTPKRDINGNQINHGDRLVVKTEGMGYLVGMSGIAYLWNPIENDIEFMPKHQRGVLIILDEPFVAEYGYESDWWTGPIPEGLGRKMYVFRCEFCEITEPFGVEDYTEEELEDYE